jgi:hypothetical protein
VGELLAAFEQFARVLTLAFGHADGLGIRIAL